MEVAKMRAELRLKLRELADLDRGPDGWHRITVIVDCGRDGSETLVIRNARGEVPAGDGPDPSRED